MTMSQNNPFVGNLSGSPVTLAIVGVNVLFFLLLTITGGSDNSVNLYRWGAKYGPAIADGEWWRLILPIFIHIGFLHLLTNTIGLLIFGSMVERLMGSAAYLAVYLVTGALGNVASFIAGPTLGAGASGAVFGVIGAFAVYLLLNRRVMGSVAREALTSVVFIIVLNIVIGFSSKGIDNAAHLGGLIGGMIMSYIISPRQRMVITPGWGSFAPPRMAVSARKQGNVLIGLAVATGVAIAVIGTYIRAQDYPHSDTFELCDYHFGDFSDPDPGRPFGCRSLDG